MRLRGILFLSLCSSIIILGTVWAKVFFTEAPQDQGKVNQPSEDEPFELNLMQDCQYNNPAYGTCISGLECNKKLEWCLPHNAECGVDENCTPGQKCNYNFKCQ